MDKYKVTFMDAEYEEFKLPSRAKEFTVMAYDLTDAVRLADKRLYELHAIGYEYDYTTYDFSENFTQCYVSFGDADRGWTLRYRITKE